MILYTHSKGQEPERKKGSKTMTEMLKTAMKNDENLAKAYKMVKNTLAAEYGEAFTNLSAEEQAQATGKVLADLLGI